MEYFVLRSSTPEGLQDKVREKLNEGFEIIGGVQANILKQQNRFRGSQHTDTINQIEYVQSVFKK